MAKLPRGVALSGLEFGAAIPGSEGIDFFKPSNADIDYFTGKGMTLYRIPFKWERMQPTLGGALDTNQLGYLQSAIDEIKLKGAKAVIECHNFGKYFIYASGGFNSNFTTQDQMWLGGSQGAGVGSVGNFQRMLAGSINNPVSPATGYKVTADLRVDLVNGADVWRSLWLEFFRVDDNNKYFFTMNTNVSNQHWEIFKVVGGIQNLLGSGNFAFSTGVFYTIEIDCRQADPTKINLKINGSQTASLTADANLTHGQIALFSNGVNGSIDNVTLNVNGDTTSGASNTGNHTVGGIDGLVTIANFSDLWSKLATHFKNELGISAYDLMNEPNGMAVPTTPLNYNTTATITLMHRAAVTAIRATGDTHQLFVETDEFSGLQNFTNQYGTNPTFWISDPLSKTGFSCHYYPDSDHSGTFGGPNNGFLSSYFTRVDSEVPPALVWAKANNITIFIGEYGIPDDPLWYPTLNKILTYMDTSSAWGTYWAAGVFYGAITGVEPTSNFTVDKGQLTTLLAHLPDIFVQPTSPPPVSGTAGVGSAIGLLMGLTYATGSGTGGGTVTPPAPPPSNVWQRRRSSGVKWTRVTHR